DVGRLRKQVVEMVAPAGAILALTVSAHGCQSQHAFDALAHAGGCFGLCGPNRLQGLKHVLGADRRDRQGAKCGTGVIPQRIGPLAPMLGIAPGRRMGGDVEPCAVIEGRPGGASSGSSPRAFVNWINPAAYEAQGLVTSRTRFGKAHLWPGSKTLAPLF